MFTSWYQEGVRAFDYSRFRRCDPAEGKLVEIAAFDPPAGDVYWNALTLEDTEDDVASDPERFYTVGSDTGKGLHVLELARTGGESGE